MNKVSTVIFLLCLCLFLGILVYFSSSFPEYKDAPEETQQWVSILKGESAGYD